MSRTTHGFVVIEGRLSGTKNSFIKRLFRVKQPPEINQAIRDWRKNNHSCQPIQTSIAFKGKCVLVAMTYESN